MESSTNDRTEEELLPIDIYYNKLLDWLLDRRHCDIKWQPIAVEIREKINDAIQDMPPVEEITNLLQGTHINYFHCLRIVELLKVSESASKNIFGSYSSKRMKDWQEVIRLYEKDNVYLAEVASLLIRNVNYEIPSLKRQIGKCQLTQRECTKKESEFMSNAGECKTQYRRVCEKMGIKGEKIKTELMDLLSELPDIFTMVSKSTEGLQDALQYYKAFIEFVSPSFTTNEEDKDSEVLSLLTYIQEHGNTTVYQWRTGQVPAEIESTDKSCETSKEETNASEEIDWGEPPTLEDTDNSGGIDWETNGEENAGGIDWGTNGEDNSGGIDWGGEADIDIIVEDSGCSEIITLESSGEDTKIVTGSDARTVLDNTETRNIFIDELMELQGFLNQRLLELGKGSDVVTDTQLQTAPQIIQRHSKDSIEKMAARVVDVLSQLTNMRVQNLCLLKNSPRYVDRLADTLQQKLRLSEKLVISVQSMAEKRKEAAEQQRELEPQLDVIRNKTKELQSQIAAEISKKYKNRPVNVMGEINSI